MLFPLALSSHQRIVIVPQGWFAGIGNLDAERGELTVGINRLGDGGLAWFIDADGLFYELVWQGRQPKTLAQFLGLTKQRERYAIKPGRPVAAWELLALITNHSDQFSEAPNSDDLRKLLTNALPNDMLQPNFMREYFGK